MRLPLYISEYNETKRRGIKRASHLSKEVQWSDRLPPTWKPLANQPMWVEIQRDSDSQAERWLGFDEDESPCFCRYIFQIPLGQSHEPGVSMYGEDLAAWRLRDGRWLIHRTIQCQADSQAYYAFYAFSETMPK